MDLVYIKAKLVTFTKCVVGVDMNKIKLLFYACSPFPIGYFLNYAILKNDWYYTSAISILSFVYWFFVGYISHNYVSTIKENL